MGDACPTAVGRAWRAWTIGVSVAWSGCTTTVAPDDAVDSTDTVVVDTSDTAQEDPVGDDTGDDTEPPDTGSAPDTDDTDAAAAGPGLAADPFAFELTPALVPVGLPLRDDAVAVLDAAQAALDGVRADVADARAQASAVGCGPDQVAWRGGTWYPTVTAAAGGAGGASVVLICGGDHAEAVLARADRTLAPLDPTQSVTLRARGNDPVVRAYAEVHLALVDVTVVGAAARAVAAVRVDRSSDVVLAGVHLEDLDTLGLEVAGADLAVVAGCWFDRLQPATGTGGGARVVAHHGVLWSNTFREIEADVDGAGVDLQLGDADAEAGLMVLGRNRFARNRTRLEGGAVHAGTEAQHVRLLMAGNRFAGNEAADGGGGLRAQATGGQVVSSGDAFVGNRATFGAAAYIGFGETIHTTLSDVVVTDNSGFTAVALGSFRPDATATLMVQGGWFARNDTVDGALNWTVAYDATGTDVGFGQGSDANLGGDILACDPLPAIVSWRHPLQGACEVGP